MTCSGCRFWIDAGCITDSESFGDDWGQCIRDESPDAKMQATCYNEGICGELITHKDFGCNEYQVKK